VSRARAGLVVATRVAGYSVALFYLLGADDGPVLVVVGGLGLAAIGRIVHRAEARHAAGKHLVPRFQSTGGTELLYPAAAFVVVAVGLTIPSLRWRLLDLSDLRGVQAVLGPTLLVGPASVAISAWVAAVATLIGFAHGIVSTQGRGPAWWFWSTIEIAVGALAAATVYYGPAIPGWGNEGTAIRSDVLGWAAALGIAAISIAAVAWVVRRISRAVRWAMLGACGVAVLVTASVLAANP
jgi:hypothetical protein